MLPVNVFLQGSFHTGKLINSECDHKVFFIDDDIWPTQN